MKRIITVLLIIILSNHIDAQFNKVGRTALQFLKIGNGTRQVAQGEASIAYIKDVNAIFWNPAATAGIQGNEAAFNYNKWIADLNVLSGAVGIRFSNVGVFTFSFLQLDYGDLDEALISSTTGGLDTRTGSVFSGGDLMLGFGFARYFTDKLSIGINIKYIREDLYTYSSSLWAFDVGSYYETGWKGIRIAMSAQNFSGQARWMNTLEAEQQSYELPIIYRIGGSIDLFGGSNLLLGGNRYHKFTFSFDAIHTNDYGERLNLGIEYWFLEMLAIRGGYKFNYDEGNLSAGLGILQGIAGITLKFDYAYVYNEYLNSTHRFSVLLDF